MLTKGLGGELLRNPIPRNSISKYFTFQWNDSSRKISISHDNLLGNLRMGRGVAATLAKSGETAYSWDSYQTRPARATATRLCPSSNDKPGGNPTKLTALYGALPGIHGSRIGREIQGSGTIPRGTRPPFK